MKKRLWKLGDAARARGEKDNQAAVIAGMEGAHTVKEKAERGICSGREKEKLYMR